MRKKKPDVSKVIEEFIPPAHPPTLSGAEILAIRARTPGREIFPGLDPCDMQVLTAISRDFGAEVRRNPVLREAIEGLANIHATPSREESRSKEKDKDKEDAQALVNEHLARFLRPRGFDPEAHVVVPEGVNRWSYSAGLPMAGAEIAAAVIGLHTMEAYANATGRPSLLPKLASCEDIRRR